MVMGKPNAVKVKVAPAANRYHSTQSESKAVSLSEFDPMRADALTPKSRYTWSGEFRDSSVEQAFRAWEWERNSNPRRITLAVLVIHCGVELLDIMSHLPGSDNPESSIILALMLAVGYVMLSSGFYSHPFVVRWWGCIAGVGLSIICLIVALVYRMSIVPDSHIFSSPSSGSMVPWQLVCWTLLVPALCSGPLSVGLGVNMAASCAVYIVTVSTVASNAHVEPLAVAHAFIVLAAILAMIFYSAYRRAFGDRRVWNSNDPGLADTPHGRRQSVAQVAPRGVADVMRFISHDLRTPLHGILGLLEGAIEDETSPRDAMADMQTCAKLAEEMTVALNDVLDLGELLRGTLVLRPVSADILRLLDRCIASTHAAASVPIAIHASAHLPRIWSVDPLRLVQSITSGLRTAVKVTTAGVIDLFVFASGGMLCIEINDTGPGLPSTITTHSRDALSTESGLSMAITLLLVELMGGRLVITNRTDGIAGVRYSLRLPLPSQARLGPGTPKSGYDYFATPKLQQPVHQGSVMREDVEFTVHVVHPIGASQPESFSSMGSAAGDDVFAARRSLAYPETHAGARAPPRPPGAVGPSLEVVQEFDSIPAIIRPQPKGRLLVCDDELISRRILQRHCRKFGYTCRLCADGSEVLAMVIDGDVQGGRLLDATASAQPFTAIFLDILMQRSSGEDICKRLREAGITTPIVAATGKGMPEDIARYQRIGFSAVLLKPFSHGAVQQLLGAVETLR